VKSSFAEHLISPLNYSDFITNCTFQWIKNILFY